MDIVITIPRDMMMHVDGSEEQASNFNAFIGRVVTEMIKEVSRTAYRDIRVVVLHDSGMIKNDECAVCMEPIRLFSRVAIPPCGHGLHSSCMNQIREHRHHTCPMCRRSLHT